jgi:hypothetical protein
MFYEKLAEAKKDKEKRLSLGQQAGVLGIGAASTTAPLLGSMYSSDESAFNKFLSNRKKYQPKIDLANKSFRDAAGTLNEDMSQLDDRLSELHERLAKVKDNDSMDANLLKRKLEKLISHAVDDIDKRKDRFIRETDASIGKKAKIYEDMGSTRKHRMLGVAGLAGVAGTYGAKKLFDMYNARKQRKD